MEGATHSHCTVKSSCNLVVRLQAGATSQDLRKPKLPNRTLHVLDFPMGWGGCFDPLGWLTPNTAYHVGMCEGFGGRSVVGLGDSSWERLSDARVEGRGSAGHDVGIDNLLPSCRAIGIASPRAGDSRSEGGASQ